MSGRKEKKSASGGKRQSEEQRENILQAVVLADPFQNRFRPFTLENPRCLLPLANAPLIEYTLEFLALAGIQDVFIFASSHAEKVEGYVRSSKWAKKSSPFKNCRIIMSPASASVGDAMRELDSKRLITTDFLLVHGDFVSNLPLEAILDVHRKRRTADKNAIMTMILREGGGPHRSKAKSETGVFVIDAATSRCVHYDEISPYGQSNALLPRELFKDHSELHARSDLIDCYLDICSPDVPALFTENFDYQHIRRHFLHNILTDYELYGKTVHVHIVNDYYMARVRSLQTYDGVSMDVMGRWSYPLCPDSNLGEDQTFKLEKGSIYIESGVSLARSSTVMPMTIFGAETTIGENSTVGQSTFGRNCKVGRGVAVDQSYVWDNVVIGDGCKIQSSIVASRVELGRGCIVERGALISYGVHIPDGTVVKPGSRITLYKKKTDTDSSEDEERDASEESLAGYEYEESESGDEEETISAMLDSLGCDKYLHFNQSESSISTISDEDEDGVAVGAKALRGRSDSVTTAASDGNAEADAWHREATVSLLTAMEADHPVEVASLELNGLRMTANASWQQVRKATVAALHNRIEQLMSKQSKPVARATNEVIVRWKPLIKRMIFDTLDQTDFLLLVQRDCVDRKIGSSLLSAVAWKVFDLDLIEEEAIQAWWKSEGSSTEVGGMNKVRQATGAFIKYLDEAEEESSEEEEEESEEESEDKDGD